MTVIQEEIEIDAGLERVYGAFADITGWREVLPDVLGVELLYFDGYNQEFTMTVERPGGPETVRGIRYCRAPYHLEIFQPQPPPGFRRMAGDWTFTEAGGRTRVVATRHFALHPASGPGEPPAAEREELFAGKLRGALRANLTHFKRALEEHGADPR